MTVEQTTIFGGRCTMSDGKPLTERQQLVWDMVRRATHGVAADEAGAALHQLRGRHTEDERCSWCVQEGAGVLRSATLKTLVTRRRSTGRWYCRNTEDALVEVAAEPMTPGERATSTSEDYDPATSDWPEGF